MKTFKDTVMLILVAAGLMALFMVWYNKDVSKSSVETYVSNNPAFEKSLLIATAQGNFPEKIAKETMNHFKSHYNIAVMDLSALSEIDAKTYNGILLIHTWEKWNPPSEIVSFVNTTRDLNAKIVVLAASSRGSSQTDDVDGISEARGAEDVNFYVKEAITEMDPILKN